MIFAPKMPEFYIKIARKKFSRILGGHVPPLPPRFLCLCMLGPIGCLSVLKIYFFLSDSLSDSIGCAMKFYK